MGKSRLEIQNAMNLVRYAFGMVEQHKAAKYRFGQALWNLLPPEVREGRTGTDVDFFYWKDTEKVLECFYQEYVEE